MITTETSSLLLGCALISLLIVQLFKSDKIPISIPADFRPLVATLLSLGGGLATAVLQGVPLKDAAVSLILGAVAPTGLHALVSRPTDPASKLVSVDVKVTNSMPPPAGEP
mgnify:CR=1 FL=1